MAQDSVRRSISLFSLIFLASMAAQAQQQSGSGFPLVGIASGQSARVNTLNMARPDPANATSCNVTLQFLDTKGQLIKQATVNLQPGAARSLDVSWDDLPVSGLRVEQRGGLPYGHS